MHVTLDAKRAQLLRDVPVQGSPKLTTVKLDPWLYSIGLAWTF